MEALDQLVPRFDGGGGFRQGRFQLLRLLLVLVQLGAGILQLLEGGLVVVIVLLPGGFAVPQLGFAVGDFRFGVGKLLLGLRDPVVILGPAVVQLGPGVGQFGLSVLELLPAVGDLRLGIGNIRFRFAHRIVVSGLGPGIGHRFQPVGRVGDNRLVFRFKRVKPFGAAKGQVDIGIDIKGKIPFRDEDKAVQRPVGDGRRTVAETEILGQLDNADDGKGVGRKGVGEVVLPIRPDGDRITDLPLAVFVHRAAADDAFPRCLRQPPLVEQREVQSVIRAVADDLDDLLLSAGRIGQQVG